MGFADNVGKWLKEAGDHVGKGYNIIICPGAQDSSGEENTAEDQTPKSAGR